MRLITARCKLKLAFVCLLASGSILGQTPTSPQAGTSSRPRVGLVLSGGGARGGVHIGVLQALEELNVPVDLIAGVSAGAVIGGFYASGLTANQIDTIIRDIDWDAAFLEDAPRAVKSFRRKREDDQFLVKQRPGFNNWDFQLPIGIVQGQVIDLIVAKNTLPAAGVRDFDRLPIPFRAVAADIATGEAVILGAGDFARALRASMSVPAVLAPVDIDGRLLVDGGVVMNLPVEVARALGADIIIAVDVSAPLLPREELNSVFGVTEQLTILLTRQGVVAQLAKLGADDILLTAELGREFGSASFARMAETVPIGYELAMAHAEELEALALAPAEYDAYRVVQLGRMRPDLPEIDFVRLRNDSITSDSIIEHYLEDIELGAPLDIDRVEATIDRIYGLGLYQNVRYELVEDGDRSGIEFHLEERTWGPGYAQLGIQFNASGGQDLLFGVAASYLRTALNPNNGEWRATAIIGAEPGLYSDFHQPFGAAGQYFFAPSIAIESKQLNVFEGTRRLTEARIRSTTAELGIGRELGSWGELRLGLRHTTGSVDLEVGDPTRITEGRFHGGEYFARWSADTLDSVAFPRSGINSTLEWRASRPATLSSDAKFDQVSLAVGIAKTWDRYTLLSTARYDTTIEGVAPLTSSFRMGGLFDLSGFGRQTLSGQHAARVGASFYRRVNNLALFPAFVGLSLEYGNVWNTRSEINWGSALLGGSIWIGIDTPIGPIYGAYGRAREGASQFYLVLGRVF